MKRKTEEPELKSDESSPEESFKIKFHPKKSSPLKREGGGGATFVREKNAARKTGQKWRGSAGIET